MDEDDIEKFFESLILDKKERKILRLISKDLSEDHILEALLNEGEGRYVE